MWPSEASLRLRSRHRGTNMNNTPGSICYPLARCTPSLRSPLTCGPLLCSTNAYNSARYSQQSERTVVPTRWSNPGLNPHPSICTSPGIRSAAQAEYSGSITGGTLTNSPKFWTEVFLGADRRCCVEKGSLYKRQRSLAKVGYLARVSRPYLTTWLVTHCTMLGLCHLPVFPCSLFLPILIYLSHLIPYLPRDESVVLKDQRMPDNS